MNRRLPYAGMQHHVLGNFSGELRTYESDQHDQVVPCVCQPCNGGWMSNLETRSAPILTKIALGRSERLPDRAHLLVALWVVKTMMVKQFQHPQPESLLLPPKQYAHVYRVLEPPPMTRVFQIFDDLAFPSLLGGAVHADGEILRGGQIAVNVGYAIVPLTQWQGRISKGHLQLFVVSIPDHPATIDDLPGQLENNREAPLQIWPLQTGSRQIRVRNQRAVPPR
ncbi:MAG: hypothetical protein ACYCTZ_12410 [Candidatus Dormibacteria bacterium]